MNTRIVLLIISTLFFGSSEAAIYGDTIRGENDEYLIIVDSLSYKDGHLQSEYFINAVTGEAYSGIAIVHLADTEDRYEVKDGYIDGWKKSFRIINGTNHLTENSYYDQSENIFVGILFNIESRNNKAFIKYYSETFYFFEITYKKNGRIKLIKKTPAKSDIKVKFRTVEELECFFRSHTEVFGICVQAGMFYR